MFDSLARLADGNARRIGLARDRLLPPRRRARRLGRQPPRPLRRRRPGDRDREGAGTAAGRRPAGPGGDRRGRRRAGRQARDPGPGRGARAPAARARRRRLGQRLLRHPLPRLRLQRRRLDLLRGLPEADRRQAAAGSRRRDRRPNSPASPGVVVGGFAVAQEQVNKQVENDLRTAELLAFPLLFLLSLLFFRSLVAALLPLMIGGLAIVGTFLILRIASEFGSISIFALNLTTALGLGLAIDYSLFIVSRYREEIAKDGPGLAAMRRVLATAGRTVFFSSLTVAAALASLLVFPQRFLYSMGLGGALVALFAALISLTVLPAVLTLLGDAGQRRRPALPAAPRRGRRPARRERLLVPALALRDAAAGPGGDAQRAAADRPRPALLRDQVQHRRPDRAAGVGQRAAGLRDGQPPLPALPRNADLDRPRRRRPAGGGADRRRGRAGPRGRRGAAAAAAARRRHRDRRRSPPTRSTPTPARTTVRADPRAAGAGGDDGAGRRRHRRLRRPAVAASPATCRSRWRS